MSILYELAEPLVGNGTNKYINTGIQLFNDTNKLLSWTMLIDITINTISSESFKPIVHCMNETGSYDGFCLDYKNNIDGDNKSSIRIIIPNLNIKLVKEVKENTRYQFALIKDGSTFTFYDGNMNVLVNQTTENINSVSQNLLLMAITDSGGNVDRFNDGTLNAFKLVDSVLTTTDCDEYLNGLYDDGNDNETTEDNPTDNGEEYQDSNTTSESTGTGDSGIEGVSEDSWGNENYGLPCALYFYYMGDDINAGNEYENWNTEYTNAVLGNCSAIQSIQYVPFLRKTDLTLNAVPYDVARFGQLQSSHPKLDFAPYVYRIKALTTDIKTLGSFTVYSPSKTIGGARNWKNESRLYNYPYQFAMITDHLNPPFEVKYHLIPTNTGTVKVLNTISDRCSYGLFIDGYKGDNGQLEAMVSGEAHELPCSSSAYNQWYASNKNQIAQNVSNMSQTAFLNNQNISQNQQYNILNSTVGAVGNLLSLNFGGVANSVIGGFQNNMNMNFQKQMNNVGVQQQIAMNMAQGQDLRNTPNTMISMGSDVYYGLAKGKYQLDLIRFGLTDEYFEKLGNYFAMYGYKQNKVMTINITNRYYYNYIKTIGVNIHSESIPRNHLEQIKSIFDNGVTIWHTYREGVIVGDISKDNKEV